MNSFIKQAFYGFWVLTYILSLATFSGSALAAEPDWSSSFFLPGANGTVRALAEDSQALYIAGEFTTVGNQIVSHIARVDKVTGEVSALSSGSDVNFVPSSRGVSCMVVYDGELWVGGKFSSAGGVTNTANLAKWNGVSWESVGNVNAGPGLEGVITMLVADGLLYVGGDFTSINNVPDTQARAVWTGTAWQSIGTGLQGKVRAIAKTSSGVYFAGWFLIPTSVDGLHLAKWTGTAWTEMVTDVDVMPINALATQGEDLIVAGSLDSSVPSNVLRWNGSIFSEIGSTRRNEVYAVAVSGDDIYAGGAPYLDSDFTETPLVVDATLAKNTGSSWTVPGGGVQGTVRAILASNDGLYVAGEFTRAGGSPAVRVAKLVGSTWTPVVTSAPGQGVGGQVHAVLDAGNVVYIGGDFTVAGGVAAKRIACWNKASRQWSALGNGLTGSYTEMADPPVVKALAMFGGQLYVGGNFRYAGSVDCDNIARWDGSTWKNLGSGTGGSGHVNAMLVKGSDLYVAGGFHGMSDVTEVNLIGRWNGSQWSAVGNEFSGSEYQNAEVQALAVYNNNVVAGGDLSGAFATPGNRFFLGILNGGTWSMVDEGVIFTGASRAVNALIPHDGLLYVGTTGGLKSWNGFDYLDVDFFNESVTALLLKDGELYVGINKIISLVPHMTLSRRVGDEWLPFFVDEPGSIYAMTESDEGLYVVGDFNEVGGKLSHNIALYESGEVPEMVVEQTGIGVISTDASWDFGSVFVQESATTSFTIQNNGAGVLFGEVSLTGQDASAFSITKKPSFPLPSGGTTTMTVRFAPVIGGDKTATLSIFSNDPTVAAFDVHFSGAALVRIAPSVRTDLASNLTHNSATLNGVINAKSSDRNVTFDFGLTKDYGAEAAASPAIVSGNLDTPVKADISGLLPHTKYNFRVRAEGDLGSASGANATFTTLNRAPVATNDELKIVPGNVVMLDVLNNDSDPDADSLSFASISSLNPSSAGKLTKIANGLMFAAASDFTTASFTYSVKDGFGGTSSSVEVTLTAGTCVIDMNEMTLTSGGELYQVNVVSDSAWSVDEKLSWVSVSPSSGIGDEVVNITVLPNSSKISRVGSVIIGGQTHTITQAGVLKPSISMPSEIPPAIVSGTYKLEIPTLNLPVIFKIKNMPPGLVLNGNTGILEGKPMKAGSYDMTIAAKNAAGSADETLNFSIDVAALDENLVGSFHGYVEREPDLNANMASRLELTITGQGGLTGKLITGKKALPFKAVLDADVNNPDNANAIISIARPKASPWILDLSFDTATNTLGGTLSDSDEHSSLGFAWRNPWNRDNKVPVLYQQVHSFSLEQADDDMDLPQGIGFGSFSKVIETTGAVKIVGKLADGSSFTSATFLGYNGELLIYQPLYQNLGSLVGKLQASAEDSVTGDLSWFKPEAALKSKDRTYRGGFGPLILTVAGGAYPGIETGGLILGIEGNFSTAQIEFAMGGLAEEEAFIQKLTLTNPSPKGKTNKATPKLGIQNGFKLKKLVPATGLFSGEFSLEGATKSENRKAVFQGQIIKVGEEWTGKGFFVLPDSGGKNANILSGTVLFKEESP